MSDASVARKGALGTVSTAAGWLRASPTLVGIFFLVGVLDAVARGSTPAEVGMTVVTPVAAVVAYAVADRLVREEAPDYVAIAVLTLRKLPVVLGTVLVVGAGLVTLGLVAALVAYLVLRQAGILLLVVPAIYVLLRLSLVVPAVVIDDDGVISAILNGWEASRGHVLTIVGVNVLSFLIALVGIAAVALATGASVDTLAQGPLPRELVLPVAAVTAVSTSINQLAIGRVYLEATSDEPTELPHRS